MNPSFALLIGIDRSDARLDICTLKPDPSPRPALHTVSTDPRTLHQWLRAQLAALPEGARVAVAFEQPATNLMVFFSQFAQVTLYPLNPAAVRSYARSFTISGAHTDTSDAVMIARYLAHYHPQLRARPERRGAIVELERLNVARRDLVDERTALINRLQATLKLYYPQAIALLSEDLWRPMDAHFLLRWPSLQELQKARAATLKSFWQQHGSRSASLHATRLAHIAQALPLTTDAHLIAPLALEVGVIARQLLLLDESIKLFATRIDAGAQSLADYRFFRDLPGAGPVFAARLLAAFGEDRALWTSAEDFLRLSGVAPVTQQSGQKRVVQRRRKAPAFLHQTFVEWAAESWKHSAWARAFYLHQKARGQGYHAIMRSLAYKWIRILFRAWQDRLPYNETAYLQTLRQRGNPLCEYLAPQILTAA